MTFVKNLGKETKKMLVQNLGHSEIALTSGNKRKLNHNDSYPFELALQWRRSKADNDIHSLNKNAYSAFHGSTCSASDNTRKEL